ncbi:MAG: hypothetical protein ACRDO0_15560 [Nocardioidaceae bacterium]
MFGRSGRVVHARRTDDVPGLTRRCTDPDLLAEWTRCHAEPAGLRDLLDDLDRLARPVRPRLTRTAVAFAWDSADSRTRAWVPQGVTTSADAHPDGTVHDRVIVATSWYSPTVAGHTEGARVTFVDVTAPTPRYRHVLLVKPWRHAATGDVATHPVAVHAGGLVWYGDLLFVASTYGGLRVFDLGDLVRVDPGSFGGHAYVLPQRWAYEPGPDASARMRYSFVSLDRSSTPHALLAGEYGRGSAPTRIARFCLDSATAHLSGADASTRPVEAFLLDVRSMQGVARLGSTYVVTASHGPRGRGDLWVGDPSSGFRRHRWALPAGPEDLSAWPARDLLWTLTEWPGRRQVLALRAGDWTR